MDLRFRLVVVTILALLVVIAWTLPEWWAYANPESPVAQGLPGLEIEARAQFDNLLPEEKQAYFDIFEGNEDLQIDPNPEWALALVRARFFGQTAQLDETQQVFEPPDGATQIASGSWRGIDAVREVEGEISIYRLQNGTRVLYMEDNFVSLPAPGIHLIFTRNPDPTDERGVGVDFIDLGPLKSTYGTQEYVVPDSVDFSRYPVVVLYSVEFEQVLGVSVVTSLVR